MAAMRSGAKSPRGVCFLGEDFGCFFAADFIDDLLLGMAEFVDYC
jgi:hypothetical protein